ncbi:MAG: hypothetical protein SVU32_07015, partial [Candidatus Nanohaloarchaea archaeon]|nr:hypothetical protein [Candidatus Nanohaloarchaea archaeon]
MGYREELLSTKENAYRALLSDIEEQRQDWQYLRQETEWEQLEEFDREVVRLDDPELASALDDYEEERERCRDILEETTTYIVHIAQHLDRSQNECMFREKNHEQDVKEHEIQYTNSIISSSLGSHELVAVYGKELA